MGRLVIAAIARAANSISTASCQRLANLRLAGDDHTLDTAFFGAVLAVCLGGPFAVAVAMTDLPGRKALGFLLLLPLMIAPQVTALSWLHLFGPSSTLLGMIGLAPPPGTPNPMLGRNGIILLYAIQHAPIVFITLRAGLSRVPRDLVEAARASGARPLSVLWTIVLPVVRPYIVAAAALAFVSGVGNFGIPALLGMPVNYLTLPTLIYQDLSSFGPGVLPQITALSVVVAVLALAGVPAVAGLARRSSPLHPGPGCDSSLEAFAWVRRAWGGDRAHPGLPASPCWRRRSFHPSACRWRQDNDAPNMPRCWSGRELRRAPFANSFIFRRRPRCCSPPLPFR